MFDDPCLYAEGTFVAGVYLCSVINTSSINSG